MNHVRFKNKTLHKLVIYIWIHCLENGILFLLIMCYFCYFCCMQWMDTDTMPFQSVLLRCKLTFKSLFRKLDSKQLGWFSMSSYCVFRECSTVKKYSGP